MLHTLEGLEDAQARQILAEVSVRITPANFQSVASRNKSAYPEIDKAVYEELRTRSERKDRDANLENAAMLEILSSEMSRLMYAQVTKEDVRSRLGSEGKLPPELYSVSFSPKFDANRDFYGVRESHVISAVHNCDQAQHFTTVAEGEKGTPFVSLFVQTPRVKGARFTIIVYARRFGAQLVVEDAYKVYHDEVPLAETDKPLVQFQKFVAKFGLDLTLEYDDGALAYGPARLIHEVTLELPPGRSLVAKVGNNVFSKIERAQVEGASDDHKIENHSNF